MDVNLYIFLKVQWYYGEDLWMGVKLNYRQYPRSEQCSWWVFWRELKKWKGQISSKILNCKVRVQIGTISWCYLQSKSEQASAKARKSLSMIIWKCDTLSLVAWVCSYLDTWYSTRQSCEVTFRYRSNESKPWFSPRISDSPFPSIHYLAFLFHSTDMLKKQKQKHLNVNAKFGEEGRMSNIQASIHDVSAEGFDPSNLICFKCEMILHSLTIRLHVIGF